MPRVLHRLSAVQIKSLKDPGYYADGGNLYLQVTKAAQPAQDDGSSRARTSHARARARLTAVIPATQHDPSLGATTKAPTPTKSWVFRFTLAGRTRDMGLGKYPVVSLEKARELAARCRQQVAEGIDPIEARKGRQRQAAGRVMTFRECAAAYVKAHEASWVNAKHRAQWRSTLGLPREDGSEPKGNYPKAACPSVIAIIGARAVSEIDTADVMSCLQPLWDARLYETCSRVRGRIEKILDWAKVSGYRSGENPARWRGHLDQLLPSKRKVRSVKHHPAVPWKDIPAFMTQLRARDSVAARALEFGILTATRSQEFRRARWPEIDTEGPEPLWTVPGGRQGRMKRKSKDEAKDHRVPLSKAAVALLEAVPRVGDYVFPGQRKGDAISDTSIRDVLRDLGYAHDDATIHGFRSSFRDWAAEKTNFQNHVAEAALAHEIGDDVEAAYRRGELLAKRRQLMEAWAGYCASKPAAGKVVPFERRA
jgi:integrase